MDDVYLRIELRLFGLLKRVFDTVASDDDVPIDEDIIDDARHRLDDANINALPGLPIVVALSPATLNAISGCFEVGGECAEDISDDDYEAIRGLLGGNARMADNDPITARGIR